MAQNIRDINAGTLGGSLYNQILTNFPPPVLPKVGPEQPVFKSEMFKGNGIRIFVKKFNFIGNFLISKNIIDKEVQAYLNRELTFADLKNVAAIISDMYRNQGYIATVVLPEQDVTSGVVNLKIIEARFSGVVFDSNNNTRLNNNLIKNRIERIQPVGNPVNTRLINEGLLISQDLSGVTLSGGLIQGVDDGETGFSVFVKDKDIISGDIGFNNNGGRSTGANQLTASLNASNGIGSGEQVNLNLLRSVGSEFAKIGFSLPVYETGLKFSSNASYMDYKVVAPELSFGDFNGTSSTAGFELSQPLLRSDKFNIIISSGIDAKTFINKSSDVILSNYKIISVNGSVNANLFDNLFNEGVSSLTAAYTFGRVDLSGSPNSQQDLLGPQTAGNYSKIKTSITRTEKLTETASIFVAGVVQKAFKNLDSSEKLSLGGPSGVRAYPSGEGSGSSGSTITVELRQKIPTLEKLEAFTFFDFGQVYVNEKPYDGAAAKNTLNYKGYGLGFNITGPYEATTKIVWSHRIGDNPNPSQNGKDQDGQKREDRFWISSSINY
jgi:hemolysin activation/secretion protein